jgi:ATP-citrate lyase beta-subunit
MARQRISEFRAKTILAEALGQVYDGVSVDAQAPLRPQLAGLPKTGRYVIKVDQGVKGRMKQGLVRLDRTSSQAAGDIAALSKHGYRFFLVEPLRPHDATSEHYLVLESGREGDTIGFSAEGGIDIESQADNIQHVPATTTGLKQAAAALGLDPGVLESLHQTFQAIHSPFLEINPLVVANGRPMPLDVAAEVDAAAAPLVHGRWSPTDFRVYRTRSPQELAVEQLASGSQASFQLEVLNPNGAIFVLLSGGGASIVVADEINNQGYGHELANYGEYSGNPSPAETYQYTKQLLSLLLGSKAKSKVLIIAGAVANFTDVRATFSGVIQALGEVGSKLQRQGVRVFVRRGGPHEVEGLANLRAALERYHLLGQVSGPEQMLAEVVTAALPALAGGSQ